MLNEDGNVGSVRGYYGAIGYMGVSILFFRQGVVVNDDGKGDGLKGWMMTWLRIDKGEFVILFDKLGGERLHVNAAIAHHGEVVWASEFVYLGNGDVFNPAAHYTLKGQSRSHGVGVGIYADKP